MRARTRCTGTVSRAVRGWCVHTPHTRRCICTRVARGAREDGYALQMRVMRGEAHTRHARAAATRACTSREGAWAGVRTRHARAAGTCTFARVTRGRRAHAHIRHAQACRRVGACARASRAGGGHVRHAQACRRVYARVTRGARARGQARAGAWARAQARAGAWARGHVRKHGPMTRMGTCAPAHGHTGPQHARASRKRKAVNRCGRQEIVPLVLRAPRHRAAHRPHQRSPRDARDYASRE